MQPALKVILLDAGGVLYLNRAGRGYLNEPLVEFVRTRQGDYRFGVISTTEYDLANILKMDGIADLFELVLTSGEMGMDKSESAIYLEALRRFGIAPGEALLIDNSKEYIDAACRAGLHTVLYRDFESCMRKFHEALNGILIP